MRLYVDDDSVDPGLIRVLRRDGHDVQLPADDWQQRSSPLGPRDRNRRAVLTRNYGDFEDLHDLVVFAANGHHEGILIVRFDNNPRNNMTPSGIARAIRNLENASVPLADAYHELNHWQ